MAVKVVTGWLALPSHPRTYEESRDLGARLLRLPVPKIAYLEPRMLHDMEDVGEQNTLVPWTYDRCWLAPHVATAKPRPPKDNDVKDTVEYAVVQHQKTAWLAECPAQPDDVLVWIDFCVLRIPGVTEQHILEFLSRVDGEQEAVAPGCWDRRQFNDNAPCWRFCGSTFACPKRLVMDLQQAVEVEALSRMQSTGRLSWEVNTWAAAELAGRPSFKQYKADHDPTLFTGYQPSAMLLDALATKYGTDKGTWGYLPHYVRELAHRRSDVKQVLEIGICGQRNVPNNVTGASLWMWHDYFPNAHIHGIDIDPRWIIQADRITSYLGDQQSPESLQAIAERGAPFDLIVDDAVHDPDAQLVALRALLPFLKPDGLYAVEDVCPYKLPNHDITVMTAQIPEGFSCEVIRTHKPEVLLFVKRERKAESGRRGLGLVMVVKNEAHGIVATLDSVKGYIDHWTILDTGSTDGTQDLIRKTLDGIPGKLHEEPFVDFSTSYNRVFELHGRATEFVLHLLGDEVVTGADKLRDFCSTPTPGDAFLVALRHGETNYKLTRLSKTGTGWRYSGRTHEAFGKPDTMPAGTVADCWITRGAAPDEAARKHYRWELDRDILEEDLQKDPNDVRAMFYLAQTYECLGDREKAEQLYRKRAEAGGFGEEVYESKFRAARCMKALGRPWPEVQQMYLDAYAYDPRHAEPLLHIAQHWYDQENHALSYLFASLGAMLDEPQVLLFTDPSVYAWRAADKAGISGYYLAGRVDNRDILAFSERATEKAIRGRPDDARLRNNRVFYTKTAVEMFRGFHHREIPFKPEPGFNPMNPSIWFDGERWRCLVRTADYELVNGSYFRTNGKPISVTDPITTRNYIAELDGDFNITRSTEMVDRSGLPRSDYPVHGFEDCRLFSHRGDLYCTASVRDLQDNPSGVNEIALLNLDDDYTIKSAKPLRGPWSDGRHQKNWMPLVRGDDLFFVYSTAPEAVFSYKDGEVDIQGATSFASGRLRGGSQFIRVPHVWIGLVHDVQFMNGHRIYLHRFVIMSDDFKVRGMTDLFSFVKRGIEFCAGLAFDAKNERLVASFSVEDKTACLGFFDWSTVLQRLRSDYVV